MALCLSTRAALQGGIVLCICYTPKVTISIPAHHSGAVFRDFL